MIVKTTCTCFHSSKHVVYTKLKKYISTRKLNIFYEFYLTKFIMHKSKTTEESWISTVQYTQGQDSRHGNMAGSIRLHSNTVYSGTGEWVWLLLNCLVDSLHPIGKVYKS